MPGDTVTSGYTVTMPEPEFPYRWTIRGVDERLVRLLRVQALESGRQLAELVNEALRAYLLSEPDLGRSVQRAGLPPSWTGEGVPRDASLASESNPKGLLPREEMPDWGEGYTTSQAMPQPGQEDSVEDRTAPHPFAYGEHCATCASNRPGRV